MKIYKLGRALFGAYFVYSGVNHFLKKDELKKYAKSKNVPKPEAVVIGTGIAMIAGGAALALGVKPHYAALPLIGFLATVSPTMHNFWSEENPNDRMHSMVDFGKNMALLSGALAMADAEGK